MQFNILSQLSSLVKSFFKKYVKHFPQHRIFNFLFKNSKKSQKIKYSEKNYFFQKKTCKIEKNVILYVSVWMNTTYTLSYTPLISLLL